MGGLSKFTVSAGTYCIRKIQNGEQTEISFGKQEVADGGALRAANAQPMEWDVRVISEGYKYVQAHPVTSLWEASLSTYFHRLHVGNQSHLVVELSLDNKDGATLCLFPEDSSTSMFRLVL